MPCHSAREPKRDVGRFAQLGGRGRADLSGKGDLAGARDVSDSTTRVRQCTDGAVPCRRAARVALIAALNRRRQRDAAPRRLAPAVRVVGRSCKAFICKQQCVCEVDVDGDCQADQQ